MQLIGWPALGYWRCWVNGRECPDAVSARALWNGGPGVVVVLDRDEAGRCITTADHELAVSWVFARSVRTEPTGAP